MNKQKHIVITGGGTGGHIVPALTVADELAKLGCTISFIGSFDGPEAALVKQAGYDFYPIQAGKLRRYIAWENIRDLFRVIIGFFQARTLLARLKPAAVFAKGGYVSVPVVYAAAFLEIPVVAHESDVVMGLANALAVKKAELICTGFPVNSYSAALRSKLRFTGNVIRPIFYRKLKTVSTKTKRPTVLVIGGSQGARPINNLLLGQLEKNLQSFNVILISGKLDYKQIVKQTKDLPQDLKAHFRLYDYVGEELPDLMAEADVVVSRAGANVLAEVSAMAKPVILIPLPSAASDHQRANARAYEDREAAIVYEESDLTPELFHDAVVNLLQDREKQQELRHAIQYFRSPNAAQLIAESVLSVI